MTDGADLEGGMKHESGHLFSVWPTNLGKEWRARTRYGKLHFVLKFPGYVFGWALLLTFAAIMALGFYGLKLIWWVIATLSSWKPAKHRGEENGR